MVRLLGVVVGSIASFGMTVPQSRATEPAAELKMGLPQTMFKEVSPALVKLAAKLFADTIQEKSDVKVSVEVVADYKTLAEMLQSGKIDLGVFHGFEYAWVKDIPGLVPLVATIPNCGKVQACLVVNIKSQAKEPKDLKGACVLIPDGSKGHCFMYLDHLRSTIPAGDCSPAKSAGLTPERACGEVATGRAEVVLIDAGALIALENNFPGCYKQLKVLAQSAELPSAVVVYRKAALDAPTAKRIRGGLIDCVKTPIGRSLLLFWQLKGFEDVSPAYLERVDRSLKAYPPPMITSPANPKSNNCDHRDSSRR